MDEILHSCYRELGTRELRLTPQREAVLLVLYRNKNGHLTSYELFQKAKEIYPELGLATVYRTLDLFLELGLVRELQFDKGLTHYELKDPRERQHHHLVCKKCGHLQEIAGIFPQQVLDLITQETGFQISEYCCLFYGYCAKCRGSMTNDLLEEAGRLTADERGC